MLISESKLRSIIREALLREAEKEKEYEGFPPYVPSIKRLRKSDSKRRDKRFKSPIKTTKPENYTQEKLDEAYAQMKRWNKEFMALYKPGTNNAKNISKLLDREEVEDPIGYKSFYGFNLGGDAAGLFDLDDERSVIKDFMWDQSAADVHGYFAAIYATQDPDGAPTGDVVMIVNPKYWFERADESERKRTFFHELEHVVSKDIGLYVSDWHTDETDWDKHAGNVNLGGTVMTSQGSGEAMNARLLKTMFSPKYIPEWAKGTEIKSIGSSLGNHLLGRKASTGTAWAALFDEQRSEIKSWININGGLMTKAMMSRLCSEKQRASKFDWENADTESIYRFQKTFKDLQVRMLLLLNCEDPDGTMKAANQLAAMSQARDSQTGTV